MNSKHIITVFTALLVSTFTFAREYVGGGKSNGNGNGGDGTAANCSAPVGKDELSINNVRALIHTGGDMWWDLVGQPRYEVPKGSGRTALFAGSLWLGGRDASGQLKVAALRFRSNGTDFWTGPLNTTTAEIEPSTCLDWDTQFKTKRLEIDQFVQWYNGADVPDYNGPTEVMKNWPAHGDPSKQEDWNLAPFYDNNDDGYYNIEDGDYPGYDLSGSVDCGGKLVYLYGDENLWWVFNDKGNIHTETGGQSIGMEIRAQGFSFATNDEVNNMTFYNYELVNRSTFELRDTYFGFWVDADLGNAQDDYVGCDVERGLGYSYNGDEYDEDNGGALGYGSNPPAIGADFFQGPFQDADGVDNCLCDNYIDAINDDGIVYDGSGVGYGDGVVDNERLGMRAFLYHNNAPGVTGDPVTATDYYNYLRSFWRDNTRMVYGGTGHQNNGNVVQPLVEADFMFPGDSDPLGWGTGGNPQADWTEVSAANTAGDRRFIQSAGPFKLSPGAVNNITVGIVWARANSGGAEASVAALKQADTKTQALFDNCFQLLDGPDAPTLAITELDKELNFQIQSLVGNNVNEIYNEVDPFIVAPDSLQDEDGVWYYKGDPEYKVLERAYRSYKFQGYQVFQLKDPSVSSAELYDDDKARLVFQCDIKDEVTKLINYRFDLDLEAVVPELRVDAAVNDGVYKTFAVTEDAFATGEKSLVNFKTYYYMAIAYAHNNYKTYNQTDPFALDGQTTPYLPSRKSALGPIIRYSAIPHAPTQDGYNLDVNSAYGEYVPVTRLEGMGNGGQYLLMTAESREMALEAPGYKVTNPVYENNLETGEAGTPILVKVVDPLTVVDGKFNLYFRNDSTGSIDMADWYILGENLADTIFSASTIDRQKEEVVPQLGISVTIKDVDAPGTAGLEFFSNGLVGSKVVYDDPTKQWLSGISNVDGNNEFNWIRSGLNAEANQDEFWDYHITADNKPEANSLDPKEHYESVIEGTWAPYCLNTWNIHGPAATFEGIANSTEDQRKSWKTMWEAIPSDIENKRYVMSWLHSVDVVITADKSKWTRVPVLELQDDATLAEGNGAKLYPRVHKSVDKNGLTSDDAGYNASEGDLISTTGMGWFPGYAVDLETGERLNMAFGEDSYLISENGSDMLWNPTEKITEGLGGVRFGGKHYVYVFRNNDLEDELHIKPRDYNSPLNRMPSYDQGKFMMDKFAVGTKSEFTHVFRAGMWSGCPTVAFGQDLMATDAVIQLRVNKPYTRYANNTLYSVGDVLPEGEEYLVNKGPIKYLGITYQRGDAFTATASAAIEAVTGGSGTLDDDIDNVSSTINGGRPAYGFEIEGKEAKNIPLSNTSEYLDKIMAVPNPYYAYSEYESDKNDYQMRITNLPKKAKIKIFTLNGVMVREIEKDDDTVSYIEWDLKNHARIQVASGMYYIHVEIPGVGEKVIKWFGVLRPVDLDAF